MKKTILKISFALLAVNATAQTVPYWKLGGNGANPPNIIDGVTPANNFLGTAAGNNTWLRFGVNHNQDIFVDNLPGFPQLLPPQTSNPGIPLGGHWVGLGRVFEASTGPGSNPNFAPQAHLHIHGGNNTTFATFSSNLRPWFQTGTLYSENSDAMYVGMRDLKPQTGLNNSSYAVINWSDDNLGTTATDFLSFNFTGIGGALAQKTDGIELGRFDPTHGTFGVGNFQILAPNTYYSEPVRRVEILDADASTGLNANQPQLRTTYQYDPNPILGTFTEFQTTGLGDMYFNTRAKTVTRFFGFHQPTPQNIVEINSQPNSPYNPVNPQGSSGLRFTKLTSANTPVANTVNGVDNTKVLTVDQNGDVVLVTPAGGSLTNANNGVSANAGVVQLGVPCTLPSGAPNLAGIVATQLTTDRIIANRNQNLWIASFNNETGGIGLGGQPIFPFCNTGNTVEISANAKNTTYGNTNASGLRFAKLTSASPVIAAGTNGVVATKVLTVDGNGDVVLVTPTGVAGPVGPAGPTGATGATGPAGAAGATGATGPAGPVGATGAIGATGPAGPIGATGATGATGPVGPVGATGATGPAGASGTSNANNGTSISSITPNTVVFGQDYLQAGSPGQLISDREVPMGGKSIIFSDGGTLIPGSPLSRPNTISIGAEYNPIASGYSKLYTQNTTELLGGLFVTSYAGAAPAAVKLPGMFYANYGPVGVAGYANGGVDQVTGVLGVCRNVTGTTGTRFWCGVRGEAVLNGGIGVSGTSLSTSPYANYGGYFEGGNGVLNYGVYASAPASGGTTGPNYAGYFNGDVVRTGTDNFTSDQKLKQNIDTIANALNTIMQLKPKTYTYKQSSFPSMSLPAGKQYGLIAQDVQTILPELVNNNIHPAAYDSLGNVVTPAVNYLSLEYQQLTGIMVRAMQQQQAHIQKQDSLIAALSSAINTCCSNNSNVRHTNTSVQDVSLSDKDVVVLNQNTPNPFAEQTTITYNIPQNTGAAQLVFYDVNGRQIKTVDITTKGAGQLNVYANDLTNGIYSYTLIVDGKIIDTKRMIKQQ